MGLSLLVHLRPSARHVTVGKLSLSLFMTRIDFKLPSYCHLLFLPMPRKPLASTVRLCMPLGPQCMWPHPHCRSYHTVLAQNLGGSFALKFKSLFRVLAWPPSPFFKLFECVSQSECALMWVHVGARWSTLGVRPQG